MGGGGRALLSVDLASSDDDRDSPHVATLRGGESHSGGSDSGGGGGGGGDGEDGDIKKWRAGRRGRRGRGGDGDLGKGRSRRLLGERRGRGRRRGQEGGRGGQGGAETWDESGDPCLYPSFGGGKKRNVTGAIFEPLPPLHVVMLSYAQVRKIT